MAESWDSVVIGGGFFGLYLSEYLRKLGGSVLVVEKDADFMQRASYVNQARVHNGYHYPRSILTAYRSRANFPRFCQEFPECLDRSFTKVYAIGQSFSKVSAEQFRLFMTRIGSPIQPAPSAIRKLFSPQLIEDVFEVLEYAFDAVTLKKLMLERIRAAGVQTCLHTEILRIEAHEGQIALETQLGDRLLARRVFNCTYSQINQVLHHSGLPLIPLKHEMTEMALVEMPQALRGLGVTVMCGPFFSAMPFPPRGLHSLSHVRYTPHFHWQDHSGKYRQAHEIFKQTGRVSAFPHIIRDVQRYMPLMAACRHVDSLWEVKTVLPRSEVDDSRPILFRRHQGLENHHVIMGGKIDNVYDAVLEVQRVLQEERR